RGDVVAKLRGRRSERLDGNTVRIKFGVLRRWQRETAHFVNLDRREGVVEPFVKVAKLRRKDDRAGYLAHRRHRSAGHVGGIRVGSAGAMATELQRQILHNVRTEVGLCTVVL